MNVPAVVAAIAAMIPVPANVHVVLAPCPAWSGQAAACAMRDGTVYLAPDLFTHPKDPVAARYVIAHELVHEWDFANMTDADHERWLALEHRSRWWFEAGDPLDVNIPGSEIFADQGGLCGLTPRQRKDQLWDARHYLGTYAETIPTRLVAITCWWLHNHRGADGTPAVQPQGDGPARRDTRKQLATSR
jgi:hypothetical protein